MYCEGGRSRTGHWPKRHGRGSAGWRLSPGRRSCRWADFGSYQVRNWRKLNFPKVTVQYGKPLKFEVTSASSREQQQEAADTIFARMRELHAELSRLGHKGALRASRSAARGHAPTPVT